jgi:hypothetical protein
MGAERRTEAYSQLIAGQFAASTYALDHDSPSSLMDFTPKTHLDDWRTNVAVEQDGKFKTRSNCLHCCGALRKAPSCQSSVEQRLLGL